MLRCAQLGISARDEEQYTMGMVYDMWIEKGNDSYNYPRLATQDDYDRL